MEKTPYVNRFNQDLCLSSIIESVRRFYEEHYHGLDREARSALHIEFVCSEYDASRFTPDRIGEERVNLLCRVQERMDKEGSEMCYGF